MGDLSVSDTNIELEVNRGALQQLWDALIAGLEAAQVYHDDAILRMPQVGEEISGRADIAAHGLLETGEQLVKVNRIVGDGGLWVSECETRWHEKMTLLVSVAEMRDGKILRETRYRVPRQVGSHVAAS